METAMINQGRTAEIFKLGDNRILKLFRKEFPQLPIEAECRAAAALNEYDLPIPKFFGRIEEDGRTGLIYEFVDGVSMIKCMMDKPWALFFYAQKMAECHAAIHRLKIEGLSSYKEYLAFFIAHTELLTDETKNTVLKELNGLPNGESLLHGDLHPDNILFAAEKPVVIDWMTAAAGDPACDVARTMVLFKLGTVPRHFPWVTRVMGTLMNSFLCDVYLRYYIRLTGMDRRAIRRWMLPVAAARLYENVSQKDNEILLKFIRKELSKETAG